MADLPPFPGGDEPAAERSHTEPAASRRIPGWLIVLAIVLAIGLVIVLHLTGILGPGLHSAG
jgi:hypothetical protein